MADYVLKSDRYDHREGDPLDRRTWRFTTYRKGQVLPKLDEATKERLLRVGAIEEKGESQKRRQAELDRERARIDAELAALEAQKPVDPAKLKSDDVDAALNERGLSTEGNLSERRERLSEALAAES